MEGPSLVILRQELKTLKGKTVVKASGLAKIDYERLHHQKIKSLNSWGKHFLIIFKSFGIRIHFLMFGSYRINETKDRNPSLHLMLNDATDLNFYTCSVKEFEGSPEEHYDWSTDVMSDQWNPAKARRKLKKNPDFNVGDALLNQDIFSGVGNIIKNEVLFRIKVHPESTIGALPPRKLTDLVTEAKNYSFDFYRWKKAYQLKKHWLIHTRRKCPRCNLPATQKHTGMTRRRSFFCENCQVRYR